MSVTAHLTLPQNFRLQMFRISDTWLTIFSFKFLCQVKSVWTQEVTISTYEQTFYHDDDIQTMM